MIHDGLTALEVAAPLMSLVSLLAFVRALQGPRTREWLGPTADFWELLRRLGLPLLEHVATRVPVEGIYVSYELDFKEVVGTIDADPERVEELLWDAGFTRQPLAALKTLPTGETEVGSWAFRDHPLAPTQIHVVLFAKDGRTVLAAHEEYSPLNPWYALAHYQGQGYDAAAGARAVRRRLDEGVWVDE